MKFIESHKINRYKTINSPDQKINLNKDLISAKVDIEVYIEWISVITGIVLDTFNNPINDAIITLRYCIDNKYFLTSTRTDSFGNYTFNITGYVENNFTLSMYKDVTVNT